MINPIVIKKFFDFIQTPQFAKYEKDFAKSLQICLSSNYSLREEQLVEKMCTEINKTPPISGRVRILTNSVFIHGGKSQVEFEYLGGAKTQRELGDLIYIFFSGLACQDQF